MLKDACRLKIIEINNLISFLMKIDAEYFTLYKGSLTLLYNKFINYCEPDVNVDEIIIQNPSPHLVHSLIYLSLVPLGDPPIHQAV